jgi:hypothetical protein
VKKERKRRGEKIEKKQEDDKNKAISKETSIRLELKLS